MCGIWNIFLLLLAILLQKLELILLTECSEPWLYITDAFRVTPGLQLCNPDFLLNAFASGNFKGKRRKTPKVSLLLLLLHDGWELAPDDDVPEWFRKDDDDLRLVPSVWKRPEAYFRALLLKQLLFERPGNLQRIYHHGPAAYYEDLMRSENMSKFRKMNADQILKKKRREDTERKRKHLGQCRSRCRCSFAFANC